MSNTIKPLTIEISVDKLLEAFKPERTLIAVGGSLILKKYKLLDREASDVDIICSPSACDFIQFASTMQKIAPVAKTYYNSYDEDGDSTNIKLGCQEHIRFELNGIKHCVFVCNSFSTFVEATRLIDGNMPEVRVGHIIAAKKMYIDDLKASGGSSKSLAKHVNDIQDIEHNIKKLTDEYHSMLKLIEFINPSAI